MALLFDQNAINSLSRADRKVRVFGFALLTSTLGLLSPAWASMPEDQYLAALKIAEKKVQRQKLAQANAGALSSAVVRTLLGRQYEVGDQWEVMAWKFQPNMMRKSGLHAGSASQISAPALFKYEVVQVRSGAMPEITLKITQLESNGLKAADPKIESLSLVFNDSFAQTQKAYRLQGQSGSVRVSPTGIHSSLTPLELYPLDVPELLTAERQAAAELPALPPSIAEQAKKAGYLPDLSQSSWFEQDDFFGRPVQVLWQQGKPWASYLKTSNGIAVLLRAHLAERN